jgi:outer membrane protein OmpA-like peptidoglycan-associated protein
MPRLAAPAILGALLALAPGCSLVTVQQDPFPPLEIRADRPAPPPARVVLTDSNIQIMDKVQFETGSDKLLPVSFPLLDQVAAVMLENPQIEQIEIQGHTDATGSAGINRKLSAARAESVRRYLMRQEDRQGADGRQGLRARRADREQRHAGGPRRQPPRRVQDPEAGPQEDHRAGGLT